MYELLRTGYLPGFAEQELELQTLQERWQRQHHNAMHESKLDLAVAE